VGILEVFLIHIIFDVDKSEKAENFHRNLGVVQSSRVVFPVPNCNCEHIARSLPWGRRANINKAEFLTVEDSLQLSAGSFKRDCG